MSKINRIETELQSIDQGSFQKLCDLFLYYRDGLPPRGEGSVKGKDKTRTGTPDSFILLPNGKFIFAEYSTQDSSLLKKFSSDIKECFDEKKTGIPAKQIEKIILGYNSQMDAKSMKTLNVLCLSHNCQIEFLDIEKLKYGINDYPKIAKDFLNIEFDSEQILKEADFLEEIERKSTSQRHEFISRDNEIGVIVELVTNSNLTLIKGKAGLGKTRLAIEAIRKMTGENGQYQPYYIINKGLSLYADLKDYFLTGKKYIILVDDANRLGELSSILRLSISEKFECKLILTVRDYAIKKIENLISKLKIGSVWFTLGVMEDADIVSLLRKRKITNSRCLKKIKEIADGNPRLAMMAGDFALEHNDCNRLRNVVDIYDQYFSHFKKDSLFSDLGFMKTLGVFCFFRTINLQDEDFCDSLCRNFEIDKNVFFQNVKLLHEKELIDLYDSKIAKITDQVLAQYFFFDIYVRSNYLSFEIILNDYLGMFPGKVREVIYPILEHYGYEAVLQQLDIQLDSHMQAISDSFTRTYEFYEVFHFYKPDELLLLIQRKIETYSITRKIVFIHGKDPIFELLKMFWSYTNSYFAISLELLFSYAILNKTIQVGLLEHIKTKLVFGFDDHLSGYYRQRCVLDFLEEKVDVDEFYAATIDSISAVFLKTEFEGFEGLRNRPGLTFHTFRLHDSIEVRNVRSRMIALVLRLSARLPDVFVRFIKSYNQNNERNALGSLYEYDSRLIIPYLKKILVVDELSHSLLVTNYFCRLNRINFCPIEQQDVLLSFETADFVLFKDMTEDASSWWIDTSEYTINDFRNWQKVKLKEKFTRLDLEEYIKIYSKFPLFISSLGENKIYRIKRILEIIHVNIVEENSDIALSFLEHIVSSGNEYNYFNSELLIKLLQKFGFTRIYESLNGADYLRKEHWISQCFLLLEESKITEVIYHEFIESCKSRKSNIYLHFDYIVKYSHYDENPIKSVFEIFYDRWLNDDFRFIFHFERFWENHADGIGLEFQKRIYIYCRKTQDYPFDKEGKYFEKIFRLDAAFLDYYLDHIVPEDTSFFLSTDIFDFKPTFIWEEDDPDEIVQGIIDFSIERNLISFDKHMIESFFPRSKPSSEVLEFICSFISKNSDNLKKMSIIFTVIRNQYPELRLDFFILLVNGNDDVEFVRKIPFVSSSSGVVSSMITYYEGQLEFWESLLLLIRKDSKLLKYLEWCKVEIDNSRRRIEAELEEEYLRDY